MASPERINWHGIELVWSDREFRADRPDQNHLRASIIARPLGTKWTAQLICHDNKRSNWMEAPTVLEAIDAAAQDIIGCGEQLLELLNGNRRIAKPRGRK